jgi:hypothetical protein
MAMRVSEVAAMMMGTADAQTSVEPRLAATRRCVLAPIEIRRVVEGAVAALEQVVEGPSLRRRRRRRRHRAHREACQIQRSREGGTRAVS